jgi:hypothetical protein
MSLKKKQKIILIRANPECTLDFFSRYQNKKLDYWIYLGKNLLIFSEIEKIIGTRIKRIETGESLQDIAFRLRKPYIDFIGSFAKKNSKISWILTSISEKNVYTSNFFLMLCYLDLLNEKIKKNPGCICVFCEDQVMLRTIRKNLETQIDLDVHDFAPIIKTIPQTIQEKISLVNNKITFIRYFFLRILYARILQIRRRSEPDVPKNEPIISIHSWTDQRSFLVNGCFSEPYFGNLGQILEKNHKNFFYVIDILGTIPYPQALKKLFKLKIQWKLFEDFLEFSDIIRAWHLARLRKNDERSNIYFLDYEISELLNEENKRDRYSNQAELGALYYLAARRMAQQFSIKTFVYTFENHTWEKMTVEGLRVSCPHIKIVGYAHSTVNKMNLVYSLSVVEKNFIPTPDVILVNGPQSKEILLESGFEDNNIQIIGSLRYGNLTFIDEKENSRKIYKILVVLSSDIDRSLEMILKCVNAFSNTKDLSITFKPHPITNSDRMLKSIEILPKIFSFSSMSIKPLLETANLVIFSDSTVSVEAASMGIPLLHIKSDFTIDINIFENMEIIPSFSSPEQIRVQSLKILEGEYPSFKEIQKYVSQIFCDVDDQKIVEIIS